MHNHAPSRLACNNTYYARAGRPPLGGVAGARLGVGAGGQDRTPVLSLNPRARDACVPLPLTTIVHPVGGQGEPLPPCPADDRPLLTQCQYHLVSTLPAGPGRRPSGPGRPWSALPWSALVTGPAGPADGRQTCITFLPSPLVTGLFGRIFGRGVGNGVAPCFTALVTKSGPAGSALHSRPHTCRIGLVRSAGLTPHSERAA